MFYIYPAVETAYVQTVSAEDSHCYLVPPRKLSVRKSTGVEIYDYDDKGIIKTYQGGYKDAVFTLEQSQCESISSHLTVVLPFWEAAPDTKATQNIVNLIQSALGLDEEMRLSDADFNHLVEDGSLEKTIETLSLSYAYKIVGGHGVFVVEMYRMA